MSLNEDRPETLVQMCEKKLCNNPNLDLVNMNTYIKFGEILSFRSQDIERNEILA